MHEYLWHRLTPLHKDRRAISLPMMDLKFLLPFFTPTTLDQLPTSFPSFHILPDIRPVFPWHATDEICLCGYHLFLKACIQSWKALKITGTKHFTLIFTGIYFEMWNCAILIKVITLKIILRTSNMDKLRLNKDQFDVIRKSVRRLLADSCTNCSDHKTSHKTLVRSSSTDYFLMDVGIFYGTFKW